MAGSEQVIINGRKVGGKYKIINPPNTIATRVSGSGPMSASMLKRSEEVLKKHTEAFTGNAKSEVEELSAAVDELAKNRENPEEAIHLVFKICHNIRGQGGTFGYDLITDIAASLCNYIEELESCDGDALTLISTHVDAMRAVITENATGDGGAIGQEISKSLNLAVTKLTDY